MAALATYYLVKLKKLTSLNISQRGGVRGSVVIRTISMAVANHLCSNASIAKDRHQILMVY